MASPPTAEKFLDDPLPPTNQRWVVFALACSTSFFLYLHRYTWTVIRPELQEEYGFNNTQLESIFSVFYFSYAIGQIPSGIICDFFGAHIFLSIILLVWAVSLPCLGLTGNIYALSGIRVLFGAGQAGCYPALGKVTRVWFPSRYRTFVQGWVASFFGRGGGAVSSIIMATFLMGTLGLGWRTALVILSAAGVLFAFVFFFLYRNTPEENAWANEAEADLIREGRAAPKDGPRIISFRQVLAHGSLRVLVFQQFMNAGADIVYTSVIGSYFYSTYGVTIAEMGILASLPLWGGAIGGIVGGFLNDLLVKRLGLRWGRRVVGVAGKTIAAGVLLVAVIQTSAVAAGIGLMIVKFFSDWTQPTVWGACTDMGGRYSATIFSINNTSGNVGALVMPIINGLLLDFFSRTEIIDGSEQTVTNFVPMFLLVAAMYVGCGLCWLAIDVTNAFDDEK